MPARQIEFVKGGFYHLYNRGNNGKVIFPAPVHFLDCERLMRMYAEKYEIRILAYVLMPNHYHFLVQQAGEISPARWIYSIFNAYVQRLNRLENYSGSLFEGRYQAKQIATDAYLMRVMLYIHGNPVKDGFVEHPEDWPYSNYLQWAGENPVSDWVSLVGSGEVYRNGMEFYLENLMNRKNEQDLT